MMQNLIYLSKEDLRIVILETIKEFHEDTKNKVNSNIEEFLDIKEASTFLKLSPHTLRKKANKQEISCYKRGRKYLFSKKELIDYLLQGKCETSNSLGYGR